MTPTSTDDPAEAPQRRKRLTRGPFGRTAAVFATMTFALLAYLLLTGTGPLGVHIALVVAFGLLASRASGLQRAVIEVAPTEPRIHLEEEFEVDREGSSS